MKKCPNGHEVNDNQKYCPTCGAEIINGNKFCTKCGNERKGAEKFCPKCGTLFDDVINNEMVTYEEEKPKSGFKIYLPYIFGAIIVLSVIGYYAIMKNHGESHPQSGLVDNLASDNETVITKKNSVIADYDESKVYSGEYVFDAVLTDAALEKTEKTYTLKIDGNKVSISDGKMNFQGDIDRELKILVGYDENDGLHAYFISLSPNDREGKEWKGEWQSNAMFYNVVMNLKECRRQGVTVKITEERKSDDENNEDDVSSYDESSNSSSNVDVSSILYECQNKITSIQREIESTCRTFETLASSNDIDMMKYGQMKITFTNGVNDLVNQANKAFDKCARDLQQAGFSDAVSAVNQEKRQFNIAINELKSRTIQQVEMSY